MLQVPVASFLLAVLTLQGVDAIPLDDFYDFGEDAGDTLLPTTDDLSSGSLTLSSAFPFCEMDHFQVFVSSAIVHFMAVVQTPRAQNCSS